jgi:hypothetical protein
MKNFDVHSGAAKLEKALKTFRTTFGGVEPQWNDAARNDFQGTHLAPMEPKVRAMMAEITRLAEVLAAAERQCSSEYE